MSLKDQNYNLALWMGDNALILGHRLSEWCGHGPILEQDIAITNIALDLVGQSRLWLQMASEIQGKGKTEDDLAYLRNSSQFVNNLLVEQPNKDWAYTIVRQFLFDAHHYFIIDHLRGCDNPNIAAIAEKSFKEVSYHLRYSSEWMIRLGDGTSTSHQKMQKALDDLWPFVKEFSEQLNLDPDTLNLETLHEEAMEKITEIVSIATLTLPDIPYFQFGGRKGVHSEHHGYILAEMQSVTRAYPGLKW